MAARRDIRPHEQNNRLERLTPGGYVLGEDQSVEDVLALESSLLCSEDIDPAWPGFDEQQPR
jgi:hypothetical protein